MKKIFFLILITSFSLQSISSLQAQNTEGKEFWVTFGRNANLNFFVVNLSIRVVNGSLPANGTIFFTNLNTTINFNINPNKIFTYELDYLQKESAYNSDIGVSNKSIHIKSDVPVSVYVVNHDYVTKDATNIFPLTSLNTEYYQISYTPTDNLTAGYDAYAVIATEDSTIIFQDKTSLGVLNTGEVYYTFDRDDMTGIKITANNPVAFFAVARQVIVPYSMGGMHSHLMQQLAPVNTWGKEFFVPVSHFDYDRVRIVAMKDGTEISLTDGELKTDIPGAQTNLSNLQSGQFVELEVSLSTNGCYIESNNPIGVCTYLSRWNNTCAPPAQCWLPAVDQKISQTLIAGLIKLFPSGTQHALVLTPTATKDDTKVSIAGAPLSALSGGNWREHTTANMSFYTMPLNNDTASYFFTNPKGLIILCYGRNITSTTGDSYFYLAGSAMRDLDAAFYANDIHFQDLKDNSMCEGMVEFRAEIEGLAPPTVAERIKWFVNGTHEISALNQETWSKTFNPGTYDIRMWVLYENEDTISKTGSLIIKNCSMETEFYANNVRDSLLKDTTFCNKNVSFRAEIEEVFSNWTSIKWYVDFGSGEVEEISARDQITWGKDFENGTFPIKMVVDFENGETATRTGTLKVQALWIKMRNVRY